jgi:DNA-binding transcriptional ArsR family regulator
MPDPLQSAFRALSDPTRRDILHMLGQSQMTIGEVSDRFTMTRAAVKKHLNILAEGDLIRVHQRGRERINTLNADALRPVFDWLGYFDRFWDDKLGDLKTAIENKDISDD